MTHAFFHGIFPLGADAVSPISLLAERNMALLFGLELDQGLLTSSGRAVSFTAEAL
jgi:hypothetical protein